MASVMADWSRTTGQSIDEVTADFTFLANAGRSAGIGLDNFQSIVTEASAQTFRFQTSTRQNAAMLARMARSGIMTIRELQGMGQTQEQQRGILGQNMITAMLRSGGLGADSPVIGMLQRTANALQAQGGPQAVNADILRANIRALQAGRVTPGVLESLSNYLDPDQLASTFAQFVAPDTVQRIEAAGGREAAGVSQADLLDDLITGMQMMGISTSGEQSQDLLKSMLAYLDDTSSLESEMVAINAEQSITQTAMEINAQRSAEATMDINQLLQSEMLPTLEGMSATLNRAMERLGFRMSAEDTASRQVGMESLNTSIEALREQTRDETLSLQRREAAQNRLAVLEQALVKYSSEFKSTADDLDDIIGGVVGGNWRQGQDIMRQTGLGAFLGDYLEQQGEGRYILSEEAATQLQAARAGFQGEMEVRSQGLLGGISGDDVFRRSIEYDPSQHWVRRLGDQLDQEMVERLSMYSPEDILGAYGDLRIAGISGESKTEDFQENVRRLAAALESGNVADVRLNQALIDAVREMVQTAEGGFVIYNIVEAGAQ
jgi:hypothetical protein